MKKENKKGIFLRKNMSEEEWEKLKEDREDFRPMSPKWPIWIYLGWFLACVITWQKYRVIGEGWHGLVFMGVFFGGLSIIYYFHNWMIGRQEQAEKEREKLGISKELD
jgi:hypothetical protein